MSNEFEEKPLPVLKFRYKRNVSLQFGDDQQYPIPMTMRARKKDGFDVVLPVFDMKKVHEIPLLNEHPELPERETSFDDQQHQERCQEAYTEARENRLKNDALRKKVYHHVKRGNVEIVEDPFAKRVIKGAGAPQKPSDIAKQMDAESKKAKQPKK